VRLALEAATTYARDQGLHEVASRMSRYGSHALFRALPRILEGRERIAWELTGATTTSWNTTYSYIYRRGPLSAARYRELCANLSAELAMREGEARRRVFATWSARAPRVTIVSMRAGSPERAQDFDSEGRPELLQTSGKTAEQRSRPQDRSTKQRPVVAIERTNALRGVARFYFPDAIKAAG
jgi:hypothetical protein